MLTFKKRMNIKYVLKSPTIYLCTRQNAKPRTGNADTGSNNAGHNTLGRSWSQHESTKQDRVVEHPQASNAPRRWQCVPSPSVLLVAKHSG